MDITDGQLSGPVLARWRFGKRLREYREGASLSIRDVAKKLQHTYQTVWRWERGEVLPIVSQVWAMATLYEVGTDERAELERLLEAASKPGWWSFGRWPDAVVELLGMEEDSERIRTFDLTTVPGLLQPPEYARAVIASFMPNLSPSQLDEHVRLRMRRQTQVFSRDRDSPREAVFVIDEAALDRMPRGIGPTEKRATFARLLSPPERVTIQVVPFPAGTHPALSTFYLFDFNSPDIPHGVYIDMSLTARANVATGDDQVRRFEQVWSGLRAMALSPDETRELLQSKARGIEDE